MRDTSRAPMRTSHVVLWFVGALLVASGCGLSPPRVFHPGSAEYQQIRAERFDPYPLPDIAPEVDGGRPRDFMFPAPENERAQTERAFMSRYYQQPPPGLYAPDYRPSGRQGVIYAPPPLPGP